MAPRGTEREVASPPNVQPETLTTPSIGDSRGIVRDLRAVSMESDCAVPAGGRETRCRRRPYASAKSIAARTAATWAALHWAGLARGLSGYTSVVVV